MKAALLTRYDALPERALELKEVSLPEIDQNEVLIRIDAASINPIDARMRAGYGKTLFSAKSSLPIILGRDFSGTVIKLAPNVTHFNVGDKVFGVSNPFRAGGIKNGSHAEFICVPVTDITKKPDNIEHIAAASLPYVALTTYSALITQAEIPIEKYANTRVFVHAGAGGIGSYAIQFLKTLGAHVTTTCSTPNLDFVHQLGADRVIDYTQEKYFETVSNCDTAYDLLGNDHIEPTLNVLKSMPLPNKSASHIDHLYSASLKELSKADETWGVPQYKNILRNFDIELKKQLSEGFPRYISIVSPMMPLTDRMGLCEGMKEFVRQTLHKKTVQAKSQGRFFNYSFFEPSTDGLALLAHQITTGNILPYVKKTFPLTDAYKAHECIETKRTTGKIVLQMS